MDIVGDQTLQGKAAVRQYMGKAYIEPPQFMVDHLIADGDFVTALGKISMKNEDGKVINYCTAMCGNLTTGKWQNCEPL